MTATPSAATSSDDYFSGLAGGTGSTGSQSAQSMLEAIKDPTRYESAGYYNQMAMLNAFDGGSSGSDDDSSPFDLLSQNAITQNVGQNVQGAYNDQLLAGYGSGVNRAGFDFTV